MKHPLYFRKQVVVNTDPQRRCYDGCNFSEEQRWTAWGLIMSYSNLSDAEDSAKTFKSINSHSEYRIGE